MINQDLSWESTRVINVGLDLGLFNNQLTAELDWYDRFTTGMIRGSSISSILSGYDAPRVNIADLRNRGIEANITWRSKVGKLDYSINVNASYNVNKLEEWGDHLDRGWTALNMPYHFLYIYEAYPGLVQSWNQIYNAPYQGNYTAPVSYTHLKFRASYGTLGNNSGVGRYEQKETMKTTNYIMNGKLVQGFSASKMINQDLSWESTRRCV